MANLTYSIIACSCSKIMIGKTYWKSVILLGVLYASLVLTWTRKDQWCVLRTRCGDRCWEHQDLLWWLPCRVRLEHQGWSVETWRVSWRWWNIWRLQKMDCWGLVQEGSGGWMKQVEEYMRAVGVSHEEELTKKKKLISR